MYSIKYNNLIFCLLGMIVFSSLSTEICLKYFHLPFNAVEILIIPFAYLLRHKIASLKLDLSLFIPFLLLLLILFFISLLVDRFSLSSIVSNARLWVYLFLFYSLFSKPNQITTSDLMYLSLGALIGWALTCLLNFRMLISDVDNASIAIYGPMLSIPFFFTSALQYNKKILLVLGTLCLISILLLSGLRRAIVVAFFSFFIYYTLLFRQDKKRLKQLVLYMIFISLFMIILIPVIKEVIKEVSYSLYHRIFVRTELLLTEGLDSSSDNFRLAAILDFFRKDLIDFIIPRGFISQQTDIYDGVGIFNDFPLTQLSWIFGWPIAFCVVIRFIVIGINNYYVYINNGNIESIIYIVCLSTMFLLLFLEGTFLSYPYTTPITGIILANSVRSSHYKKVSAW